MSESNLKSANEAALGLDGYFRELISQKAENPVDDFISEVLALNEDLDQPLAEDELTANFALVYFGGQDTQEKMFSNMLLVLHRHPDSMKRLADSPKEIDGLMTELFRYDPAGQFMGRTTAVEVELCGVTIPEGETLMCSMSAASHDPKYFPRPEVFDLDRVVEAGQPSYMTFGAGRHSCLGQQLARANLPIMLKTMLMKLGPVHVNTEHAERHQSIATRVFDKMPISWG